MRKIVILWAILGIGANDVSEFIIPKKENFLLLPDENVSQVGRYTNVRIGGDGLPIIAFNDEVQGGIRVVHFDDMTFKNISNNIIDARPGFANNGRFIRMEINPISKLPYFTYISSENKSTMIAFCTDGSCKNFTTKKIYDDESTHPSITFRLDDGSPIIAYRTIFEGLKVSFCSDIICSTIQTLQITDESHKFQNGDYVHVEIQDDNIPIFSWYDLDIRILKYAKCTDKDCSLFDTTIVDSSSDVGKYIFMRLDNFGNAIMIYTDIINGYLKTAYCSDQQCHNPIINIIDKNIGKGQLVHGVFPEIGINPKTDLPVLSYVAQPDADDGSAQGILKIVQCKNQECSDFLVQEVAHGGLGYGRDSSLAFKDNFIFLSFLDFNNNNKLAYLAIISRAIYNETRN